MWSGPRNISTALLRSWENRPDTVVWDEPLYAHYLQHTGVAHPGRTETLAAHECDWRRVVDQLLEPLPDGMSICYQKQMAHHLLPHISRAWLAHVHNCLLIRDPAEMLGSLWKRFPAATLADTGLPQQLALWQQLTADQGRQPVVIDARDVLQQPRDVLACLCDNLAVPFDESMLSWPPGQRASDGAWGPFWYDRVYASTGFAPYQPLRQPLPESCSDVVDRCYEIYNQLYRSRLTPPK